MASSTTTYSCHPVNPVTKSPGFMSSRCDSMTSAMPIPRITAPIGTGGR